MKRELFRDEELFRCVNIPIVETWHIGNMSYLAARNPTLCMRYEEVLIAQLKLFDPMCIYIHIDWGVFSSRITDTAELTQIRELISFYSKVAECTKELYRRFGLPFLIVENKGGLQEALTEIRRQFRKAVDSELLTSKQEKL